jgi:nitrite reductase (NADH) small subunit
MQLLVGKLNEFSNGARKIIALGDKEIGVFRVKDKFYAYDSLCPHQGGPVCEGEILGKVEMILQEDKSDFEEIFSDQEIHLVCPWHGWEYDISTGECAVARHISLKSYEVVERGDEVYVIY